MLKYIEMFFHKILLPLRIKEINDIIKLITYL